MKLRGKLIVFFSAVLLLLGALVLSPTVAYALPYGNETLGPEDQLTVAQPSYIPEEKIVLPVGVSSSDRLANPEDMVVDKENNLVYIADTGNARIVRLSLDDESYCQEVLKYNNGEQEITLKRPMGVAINSNYVYIADRDLQKIVVLDKETLAFNKEIVRPDSILVGTTTKFAPIKVRADDAGNVYAVLEGLTKGVMQLDNNGSFISYIGANVTTTTLLARLQSFFGVQSNDYVLAAGAPVTNICLDNKGLLYTVSNNTADTVKKLNTAGNTILNMNYNDVSTVSSFVDEDGNIFSIQSTGYVTIFDSYGSLLFRFGGRNSEEILGALKSPVAAGMSKENQLLVLDKESGIIISYSTTYFANLVYKATQFYKEGLYLEGEDSWNEVLKYNAKFILAYKALARASMKKGDYHTALKQFKLAEDKQGYSDAYWQIRDNWIRTKLTWVIIPLVVLIIAIAVLKFVDKKKPMLFAPVKGFFRKVKRAPVVNELGLTTTFIRNPRETIYEIKYKKRAGVIGAVVLYVFFVALQILKIYLTGYLFNNVGRTDGLRTILMSTLPILLLVVCNYYVSSVRDGEGKLKDIFISFIYALSPYLIFALPLFLISNIVTFNEQAIYYMVVGLVYAWCGINIILTVMELHDYSLGKALINIILTLVCFILVIAFVLILYVLGYQLVSYLVNVIKEVAIR